MFRIPHSPDGLWRPNVAVLSLVVQMLREQKGWEKTTMAIFDTVIEKRLIELRSVSK